MPPDPGISHVRDLGDNGEVIPTKRWAVPPLIAFLVKTRDRDGVPISIFGMIGPNRGPNASQANFMNRPIYSGHKHLMVFDPTVHPFDRQTGIYKAASSVAAPT